MYNKPNSFIKNKTYIYIYSSLIIRVDVQAIDEIVTQRLAVI